MFAKASEQKAVIEKAMQAFHEKTCIRFVPHVTQENFINIESKSG